MGQSVVFRRNTRLGLFSRSKWRSEGDEDVWTRTMLKFSTTAVVIWSRKFSHEPWSTTVVIADAVLLSFLRIDSWEAHSDPIVCMHLVDNPPTVITAAMDRLVKVSW